MTSGLFGQRRDIAVVPHAENDKGRKIGISVSSDRRGFFGICSRMVLIPRVCLIVKVKRRQKLR